MYSLFRSTHLACLVMLLCLVNVSGKCKKNKNGAKVRHAKHKLQSLFIFCYLLWMLLFVPNNNFTIKCCLQIANPKAKVLRVNFVVSFDIKDNYPNIGRL